MASLVDDLHQKLLSHMKVLENLSDNDGDPREPSRAVEAAVQICATLDTLMAYFNNAQYLVLVRCEGVFEHSSNWNLLQKHWHSFSDNH